MELERYDMTWDAHDLAYEFYSEGPRGKIKKVVIFRHARNIGENVFNLGFGDWYEFADRINDIAISDNKDSLKY